MMNVLERFRRVVGLKSSASTMSASVPGHRVPRDLGSLAELSRLTFREPAELEVPPGRVKLRGMTTLDVDPTTASYYPDYLERRAALGAAVETEKNGPKEVYAIDRDIRPDR